jgi:hypothetical protein
MSCIVSVYLNHVIFCRSLFLFSIKTVVWYQTLADLDPLIFWPPKTFKLKTVMVNNSTHINKTKESLNSDGQQFHPYQQYEQSPLTSTQ